MTYQIYYIPKVEKDNGRGHVLFDIEYYLTHSEGSDKLYSELHCLPIVEGISYFLRDAFNRKDFIFEDFVKDSDEIQEIRGLLYESYDNKPKTMDDARQFHYHVFGKTLKDKIEKYADKYGLYINID